MLDGGILGGQAKGIEADGMQHIVAAHAGLTGHGIADGVVARVTHVQIARRIREHLEHVLLGLAVVGVNGKEVGILPGLHPLGLNGLRVVDRNLVLMICAIAHISSFVISVGAGRSCLYSLLRTVLRKTKSTFSALLCVRNLQRAKVRTPRHIVNSHDDSKYNKRDACNLHASRFI